MSKEAMNNEEKEAVKELIGKIPPEDLEKAVGGMTERQIKLLKAAGIIGLEALAIGYLKRDKIKELLPDSLGGAAKRSAKHKKSEFYEPGLLWGTNLKKDKYVEWQGKIYNKDDMTTINSFGHALRVPKDVNGYIAVISELENDMK